MLTTSIAAQVDHDFLLIKVLINFRWALGVQLLGWVLHFGHHELLSHIALICCFLETWPEILMESSIFYKTTLRIIILLSWLPIIGRSSTINSSSRRRLMTQLLWDLTTIQLSLCGNTVSIHLVLPRTLCVSCLMLLLFCRYQISWKRVVRAGNLSLLLGDVCEDPNFRWRCYWLIRYLLDRGQVRRSCGRLCGW